MALWGRAHVIKAALLAGILLVFLNFYNYHLDSKLENPTAVSMAHVKAPQWPKRTRTSSEISNFSQSVVLSNRTKQLSINIAHNLQNSTTNTFSHNTSNNSNNTRPVILKKNITSNIINSTKLIESNMNSNNTQLLNISDTNGEEHKNTTFLEYTTKSHFLQTIMTTLGLNSCPPIPPNLDGPIEVNTTHEDLKIVESRFAPLLLPGGWYKPKECNAKDRVAIIIPYRDRPAHLPIFFSNVHPFLMKQQIEYGIFLIEQISDGLFNRAALMNIGFVEALKLNDWDCFIFHDIDLLPMDDRNLYTCPDQPRHMSVAVDTMGFKLPYSSIFGGVSAMTVKQFKTVNGFSNSFWGWGGEDDDMSNRLKHFGFHIARYPVNIARYTMLNHKKEKANPKRYEKLLNGAKKYDVEGLNSLKYKLHYLEKKVLYTWIIVEVKQDSGS